MDDVGFSHSGSSRPNAQSGCLRVLRLQGGRQPRRLCHCCRRPIGEAVSGDAFTEDVS
jgi:hypothetical protein